MIHCLQCGRYLPDDVIFCLHCGHRLMSDDEPTVVRAKPRDYRPIGTILKVLLGLGGLAIVFTAGMMLSKTGTPDVKENANVASQPIVTPTPEVVIVTVTPQPTRTPKPKLSPTPISIDEVQGKIMDDETRARNANVNRPPVLPPPVITEFNRQGEQLRAICKNGEPSYWQFDKWATCGMNGGVARWNPQHPKN